MVDMDLMGSMELFKRSILVCWWKRSIIVKVVYRLTTQTTLILKELVKMFLF